MDRRITIIIIILSLASCGGEKPQAITAQPAPQPEKVIEDKTLVISTFDTIPDEISGCGCAFAADSIAYKSGHFIFADDIGDVGYMNIYGKMVQLKGNKETSADSTTVLADYKADKIEVKLNIVHGRQIGAESTEETGTIIIKQDDGQTITKSIYGECGC